MYLIETLALRKKGELLTDRHATILLFLEGRTFPRCGLGVMRQSLGFVQKSVSPVIKLEQIRGDATFPSIKDNLLLLSSSMPFIIPAMFETLKATFRINKDHQWTILMQENNHYSCKKLLLLF